MPLSLTLIFSAAAAVLVAWREEIRRLNLCMGTSHSLTHTIVTDKQVNCERVNRHSLVYGVVQMKQFPAACFMRCSAVASSLPLRHVMCNRVSGTSFHACDEWHSWFRVWDQSPFYLFASFLSPCCKRRKTKQKRPAWHAGKENSRSQ